MPSDPLDLPLAPFALSGAEQVLRHQLNLRAYWTSKEESVAETQANEESSKQHEMPAQWSMTRGISLRDWQGECIDRWFEAGGRGVVKVVTGAGKTVFAMALIERLQNEREPNLRVAVVVPTVVLMEQWKSGFLKSSNLPESAIGCLGGGRQDSFNGDVRILVAVLNSASAKLPQMGKALDSPLLLIADECHRAGADQMSRIFDTRRAYSLGLSATPERDQVDDEEDSADSDPMDASAAGFDECLLGRELGSIIFELDYRDAIERGILARFILKHYGLPLTPDERMKCERLSREITELRKSLQSQARGRPMDGGMLVGWARRVASRGGSALAEQASQYVRATGQRKLLLYHAKARAAAVSRLVQDAARDGSRIILFHESIAEVMQIFSQLIRDGHSVVVEHSKLSDSIRQESIRLFRDGDAQVLVSARSLIEGFDAPAADVGIVVASSSSVRQRVQTLGRILRKKPGEEERTAILHVLYMSETTDEMIYEKEDWEQFTGAERNQYAVWDPFLDDSIPISKDDPPRRPKPREAEIDWDQLKSGDEYPGSYEGDEYSADSQGNVRGLDRALISNPQDVPRLISNLRNNVGRFRVTEKRRAILIPAGGGKLVFGGFLQDAFKAHPDSHEEAEDTQNVVILDVRTKSDGFRFSLKIPSGELFAKRRDTAHETGRGQDAEDLAEALKKIQQEQGVQIRKMMLHPNLEVFAEISGQQQLVAKLKTGLEFKDITLP